MCCYHKFISKDLYHNFEHQKMTIHQALYSTLTYSLLFITIQNKKYNDLDQYCVVQFNGTISYLIFYNRFFCVLIERLPYVILHPNLSYYYALHNISLFRMIFNLIKQPTSSDMCLQNIQIYMSQQNRIYDSCLLNLGP